MTASRSAPSAPSAQRWPALDGLRAIAVGGVVLFHLRPAWLPGGFLGVDLFFALSGFLITSLLVREAADTGTIRLRSFWGRRFRRLLPAVMLTIAAVLAWTSIWGAPGEQASSRDDAAWAVPYLANWHLIDSARDYWASASAESPFTHLWSLAIEEQFYVLWPFVVWVLVRGAAGTVRLAAVAGTLAVASAVALVLLSDPAQSTRAYMGTDTRAFALLFGALFALAPVRSRVATYAQRRQRTTTALAIAASAALGLIWWYGGDHLGWLLDGGLIAHSLIAAALVCVLSVTGGPVVRMLGTRPLVIVGALSYGIYLWHWPVIALGRPRLTALPSAVADILLVALSVALAALSYWIVEHPIRRQLGWAHGRRAVWATIGAAALALTAIVLSPSGRGHVAAFDAASILIAPASPDAAPATPIAAALPFVASPSLPASTEALDPVDPVALPVPVPTIATAITTTSISSTSIPATSMSSTTSKTNPAPARAVSRVLWIGDSVAADEAPAVIVALEAAGLGAVNGSFEARRLVSSDNVVVEELYPPIINGADADVVVVQLTTWDSPFPVERQRAAFVWFRDLVRGTGADLVFVTPPPFAPGAADEGLARQVALVRELAAADSAIHLVDSAAVWGAEIDVDIGDDGAPDRKPDWIHVCPQGAARFAGWLVDELDHLYDGVTPAFPTAWVTGPWTTDVHYDTPVGACAALQPGNG